MDIAACQPFDVSWEFRRSSVDLGKTELAESIDSAAARHNKQRNRLPSWMEEQVQ